MEGHEKFDTFSIVLKNKNKNKPDDLWLALKKFSGENKGGQLKFSISVCECLRGRPLK